MKFVVNKDKKKGGETVIKCAKCGFKYYKGDVHNCKAFRDPKLIGVVNVEEKEKKGEEPENIINITRVGKKEDFKKGDNKTKKESFKMWKV